ncbi:class I SAM-dependent methyltransferase [Vibrio navarrensis]
MIEFSKHDVNKYTNSTVFGTGYLAYRDVNKLIVELQLEPKRALDLGCGCGRSITLLQEICGTVTGCDTNKLALQNARHAHPDIELFLNDLSCTKYPSERFDSIFSFLMFFHFDSIESMRIELSRCYESLNDGGFLFVVHGNHSLSTASYTSVQGVSSPPEKEGDRFKVLLKNINLVVEDTYWTADTIMRECEKIGFKFNKLHEPLGDKSDGQPYIDEYIKPPYFYLVMTK